MLREARSETDPSSQINECGSFGCALKSEYKYAMSICPLVIGAHILVAGKRSIAWMEFGWQTFAEAADIYSGRHSLVASSCDTGEDI